MRSPEKFIVAAVFAFIAVLLFYLSYNQIKETKACEARGGVYKIFKGGGVCFNPEMLR